MNSIKPSGGSELNFSDVIDVIEHDPDYTGQKQAAPEPAAKPSAAEVKVVNKIESNMLNSSEPGSEATRQRAQVKILEQPASKALRFRYECEGRSAGSIPGANSTPENKTYPAIQVVGYRGKAVVVVSCVTKDFPYKPHPHSLVGKEGCKKGVCTLEINHENMICTFSNLGIQCVKKKGIEEALKLREEIRVDPFHTGFSHRNQPQNIDLNAVRLCFQVFLEGAQKGKFTLALKPVVSEPIFDKKAMCDLTICKLSDFTSPVSGGKEIIMLCDKVTKDDIEIVFYHEEEGHLIWEGHGEFTASDVHKQVAISFRTPRYKTLDVEEPVNVYVQLRRPSDKECSEPRPFQFLPTDSDAEMLKRKRQRLYESNSARLKDFILDNVFETRETTTRRGRVSPNIAVDPPRSEAGGAVPRQIKQVTRTKVKKEPSDAPSPNEVVAESFNIDTTFNRQFSLNPPEVFPSGASPSAGELSNATLYQNYVYQFPTSPHYNIPLHSPNPLPVMGAVVGGEADPIHESMRAANIMDLDLMNIQPRQTQPVIAQPEGELNDFQRAIHQLPLTDSNLELIDSHLFSNLSIHDVDETNPTDAEGAGGGAGAEGGAQQQNNESAMSISNIPAELPVLTFSGMLSSADLDGADGFGRPSNNNNAL